jgi:hypothetical protein
MTNILVTYNHEPVALVNARRATLLGPVAELPAGHPQLRLTVYMAIYAQLIASGQRRGPYDDQDAQRFARDALIDPHELARDEHQTDQRLAQRFRVPVEQIAAARAELLGRMARATPRRDQ